MYSVYLCIKRNASHNEDLSRIEEDFFKNLPITEL